MTRTAPPRLTIASLAENTAFVGGGIYEDQWGFTYAYELHFD